MLSLLGSLRNFHKRVTFTTRLDALQTLLQSTSFKLCWTSTSHNQVSFMDVIVKTIMTLCKCASHFALKSKYLIEQRNALNRLAFLRDHNL